jgi:carboxylesterase type B
MSSSRTQILTLILILHLQLVSSSAPRVTVLNGSITGVHLSSYNQDAFLGVPFAQAPVGTLRFRNPEPFNETYNDFSAQAYAPMCIGYGNDDFGYPLSEDCLYLNIIRPSGSCDAKLPVAVWLYGGGLCDVSRRYVKISDSC